MTQACPSCGTLNAEGHRFCSNCGAALTKSTPAFSSPQVDSTLRPEVPTAPSYVVKTSESSTPGSEIASTIPTSYNPVPGGYEPPRNLPPAPARPPTSQAGGGFSVYTPGTTQRTEGATYAPYATGAPEVEKTKSQRSWLLPVIIGSAVLLAGLVALSGYLVLNNRGNTSTPGVAAVVTEATAEPTRTALPAGASEDLKLRELIHASNDNQIKAWKEDNEDILKENYTGQALDENIKQVQDMKQKGMYAIPVNQSLDILDVSVKGDTATAHTKEVWTVTYYNKTDNSVVQRNAYTLNETYSFVKQGGKWFINRLIINEGAATPGGA